MQNIESAGSYRWGAFRENDIELARLKQQARIALPLERSVWGELGIKPGQRVLDLGSGPGVISCALAREVAPGSVLGIDVNERMIGVATNTKQEEQVANVEFRHGSAYELDLPDASIDLVYSRFVFQHLDRPERALAEIKRVLSPGGRVCIGDVDDGWLVLEPEPAGFARVVARAQATQHAQGGDRFVGRKLHRLMVEAGLSDVRANVFPVTTQLIGTELFLDLVTGFKSQLVSDADSAAMQADLSLVYAAVKDPRTWGAVAVYYAVGTKPG